MPKMIVAALLAISIATVTVAPAAIAAEGEASSKTGWPKPTRSLLPGEKLCRYKFSDGVRKVWICDKAVPCCEWEAIGNYVKCGTTITGCL